MLAEPGSGHQSESREPEPEVERTLLIAVNCQFSRALRDRRRLFSSTRPAGMFNPVENWRIVG